MTIVPYLIVFVITSTDKRVYCTDENIEVNLLTKPCIQELGRLMKMSLYMLIYICCCYEYHCLRKYFSIYNFLSVKFFFLYINFYPSIERRKFLKWISLEPVPAAVSFLEVKHFESSYGDISNYRNSARWMLFIVFSHDEDLTLLQKVKRNTCQHHL